MMSPKGEEKSSAASEFLIRFSQWLFYIAKQCFDWLEINVVRKYLASLILKALFMVVLRYSYRRLLKVSE